MTTSSSICILFSSSSGGGAGGGVAFFGGRCTLGNGSGSGDAEINNKLVMFQKMHKNLLN